MIHIISWHTPLFFGERNLILNHDSRNLSQVRPDIKAKAHGGLGGEGLVDLIDVDVLHLQPRLQTDSTSLVPLVHGGFTAK